MTKPDFDPLRRGDFETHLVQHIVMSFLDFLPRELRNEIFNHIFTVPNGLSIKPIHVPRNAILNWEEAHALHAARLSLAVLCTCRQIYNECKDLIWKLNTIKITSFDLPASVGLKLQSIELNVDLLATQRRRGCLPLREDFIHLQTWHSLKKLDLKVDNCSEDDDIWDTIEALIYFRQERGQRSWAPNATRKDNIYHEYLAILKAAGGEDGYLSHLERRLVFDTRIYQNFEYQHGLPARSYSAEDGDPNEMLAELSCAFGGSLVVDGEVYMKDRAQMHRLFIVDSASSDFDGLDPNPPNSWYFRDDLCIWAMANFWVDCMGGHFANAISRCLIDFDPRKVLEFADSPRFSGHEQNIKAFKSLVRSLDATGKISWLDILVVSP